MEQGEAVSPKRMLRMASLDIGIDLGTCTIIANDSTRETVIHEPSVVAVDNRSGKVVDIGGKVYDMIGRTPAYIDVVHPLRDGVISDFKMTEVLIKHMLRKISNSQLVKPRVTLCVPSVITNVESQAVIDATVNAGARKVYLIEEPVAAAIGAGIDLSKPDGNLIVDIGGGTCDIAVLSLNGIVCKSSIKLAGNSFDELITRFVRTKYNLLIGARTAERIKIEIGSVYEGSPEAVTEARGRDLITGLPRRITLRRSETLPVLQEPMEMILRAVVGVLEKTPPELVGDIRSNGLVLTGGGSLLTGLDQVLEIGTKVPTRIAEYPTECVAIGAAQSFQYLGKLYDGFVHTSTHTH